MKLLRIEINQLSPGMLMDPATQELLNNLRLGNRPQKKTDWTAEEEAGTKLYRSERGHMGVPTQNIISCLISAGQHVKSGKKNISTAKTTTLFDFLEFPEDFCEFMDCDENGNVPWAAFQSKGNLENKGSKTAVCLTRPRIAKWRIQLVVIYDDKRVISEDTDIKLVATAGRKIGLCSWRPSCKGKFGRFGGTKV